MTAVNSFTLLDFLDEIFAQQPDAILIYAGHNEFYGALGAASTESLGSFRGFVKFYLKLQRFRTFLFLRDGIGKLRQWLSGIFLGDSVSDPRATLMERLVGEQTIPLHSPLYQRGKKQFESNLRDILHKAKQSGVAVMLSELVSNVRDMKPFVSVATDSLPGAEQVFRQAQALEQQQEFDLARTAYYRAKDLDALRFRATEEFNAIIHKVADEFGAPVVPMRDHFEQASPNQLIGNNLMLEHLHPNVDGYFLMAEGFFELMRQHGFIEQDWQGTRPATYYRATWGFTELDRAYAGLRVRILKGGWPFRPKATVNRSLLDFRPGNRVDSLALSIWTQKNMTLEKAHVALAEMYERESKFEEAYEEYRALILITPFNVSPYLHAADMLIKARQFGRALPYLRTSLQLEDTGFANKWLGTLLLEQNQVKEALPHLEKAARMMPQDAQVIYNLSGAYALNAQYDQAKATLKKLYEINPDFPGADDLRRQLENL